MVFFSESRLDLRKENMMNFEIYTRLELTFELRMVSRRDLLLDLKMVEKTLRRTQILRW